jgi:hypothetical protein
MNIKDFPDEIDFVKITPMRVHPPKPIEEVFYISAGASSLKPIVIRDFLNLLLQTQNISSKANQR